MVDIWKDRVVAIWPDLPADRWISRILGHPCRFVYLPENGSRIADNRYTAFEVNVSFADAFPYLLIGQSSLDDLNNRLSTNLSMKRFRPNIVIDGSEAFDEDHWKKIRIGNSVFQLVKQCDRCVVPSIDPETGLKGKEPLKTLAKYRKLGDKIYFGQNMIIEGCGPVFIDDEVEILERT